MKANKAKKIRVALIVFALMMVFSTVVVFADGEWGQNTGQWVMEQAWWLCLAVVVIMCIKYAAKKMWTQLGGFLVLGGLVVFFVKYPDKLLYIGQTVYHIVTGQ